MTFTVRDLPLSERPRERLQKHGEEALSVHELLALILGRGSKNDSVLNLVQRLLSHFGSLDASIVHPREVFKEAIGESASRLILVHNHPSGDPKPSEADIEITGRLAAAGKILGLEILDHIIIGNKNASSLKEEGLF